MGYKILLIATLAVLWLTLSGYFDKPLLLSLGVVSVFISIGVAWRMRILDNESVPYLRMFALLPYWGWLALEIVKSSITISAVILRPDMVLTPRLIRVKTLPKSPFGRTLFANSITLTPGTVSIDIDDDEIIVHTLIKEMTAREDFAEMARRCAKAAGERHVSF
ncbi:MAG: Na+/H+ antiporter subunit E [Robiginitomaculum sp.]|nr:Na+/H+ antiporter subunit E [Robiginitomaculum sp.]